MKLQLLSNSIKIKIIIKMKRFYQINKINLEIQLKLKLKLKSHIEITIIEQQY